MAAKRANLAGVSCRSKVTKAAIIVWAATVKLALITANGNPAAEASGRIRPQRISVSITKPFLINLVMMIL